MSDVTGKVVIEAIPKDEENRKKLTAFLMRYSKGATKESISILLSRLPVILIKQITSEKGQAIAAKLQQIGTTARFIAFSQPRAEIKASVSSVRTTAPAIRKPASSFSFIKPALIAALLISAGIGFYRFYSDTIFTHKIYTTVAPNEQWIVKLYKEHDFDAVGNQVSYLYDKENSAKIYDLYLLYRALGKAGNPQQSGKMEKVLNDWCAKKPESHIPYLVRGCFYIFQKQFEAARKNLEKAGELNPEDPNPPCFLIALAREANLPREAMEGYFEQAISAYPNHIGAYFEKFEYLKPSQHGDPAELFGFARKAMAMSVDEPFLAILMVYAYEEDQKNSTGKNILGKRDIWPSIRKIYEELLKKYPENMRINSCYAYHASMAQVYDISADQFDLIGDRWIADACWESADSYNQTRSYTYMKRGEMLLLDPEQNEIATKYFLKSVKYLSSADGYYGLATAYWQAGSFRRDKALLKKAEAAMLKALEIDPNHETAKEQIRDIRRAIGGISG